MGYEQDLKRLKAARESFRRSKHANVITVEIGKQAFDLDIAIFDLDHQNIGVLNAQISDIPAYVAYVGRVYAETEQHAAKLESAFRIWSAQKITKEEGKSEKQKEHMAVVMNRDEFEKREAEVIEANYWVRMLKSYSEAIKAKWDLSQTLSANIRRESEAYGRNAGEKPSAGAGSM